MESAGYWKHKIHISNNDHRRKKTKREYFITLCQVLIAYPFFVSLQCFMLVADLSFIIKRFTNIYWLKRNTLSFFSWNLWPSRASIWSTEHYRIHFICSSPIFLLFLWIELRSLFLISWIHIDFFLLFPPNFSSILNSTTIVCSILLPMNFYCC